MGQHKAKINMTIDAESRKRAEKLASKDKRSISNLFERLIADEWSRVMESSRTNAPHTIHAAPLNTAKQGGVKVSR
jgi:hypothetical protein